MVKLLDKIPNKPLAFGANCGVGASDLLRTILGFSATGTQTPIVAKGNAGIPKYHDGHIHYDGTPELMAHYATLARDCGATIIGGCCGTTPEHLRAMRAALEAHCPKSARACRLSKRLLAASPQAATAQMALAPPACGRTAGGAAPKARQLPQTDGILQKVGSGRLVVAIGEDQTDPPTAYGWR